MSAIQNHSRNKLGHLLTADPKKATVLGMLVAVLLVMVARLAMGTGGDHALPRSAAAETVAARSDVQPGDTAAGQTAQDRSAGISAALQKWTATPVAPVSRNLFAVHSDYFPMDGSRTNRTGGMDDDFWSKLEKSLAVQADRMDRRENLVANYTDQASKLRLQSTMMGPQPRAMVNGVMLGEGDVVADFRVLKIEARRIVVEREGIRLEIQMK